MKQLSKPPMLAALERALSESGTSSLDARVPARVWRTALGGPAAEMLARPGKQIRSSLVRRGFHLGGGVGELAPEAALVVELLHAGSLIVDDVEDGALERRGAPALHQLVGVPLAINTGSWMYFWALAELDRLALSTHRKAIAHSTAVRTMVRCHQGQALDLAARVDQLAAHEVAPVVAATTRLKTGALCRFAMELGALAGGADDAKREALGAFGEAVGIALQMLDDLGSLTSNTRREKAYEDLRGSRPTWPWAWLAEVDAPTWAELVDDRDVDAVADILAVATAATGRRRIRALLDTAVAQLADVIGTPVANVADDLRRMEASYGC